MSTPPDNVAAEHARKAAHPMCGFVAIAPIPASSEKREGDDMLAWFGLDSGVTAGIVLEVTEPIGAGGDSDFAMPYSVGDTVFYHESSAITLRGYHYVAWNRMIAWEEAPR